jgi:putative endonuclease
MVMSDKRKALGNRGETLAAQRLESLGYAIRERNWRCPVGELDLVAERDGVLIFVEVRTRHGDKFGTPEESITPAKRAKLLEVAQTYLEEHAEEDRNWRIDVVAIEIGKRNEVMRLDVIENAIEA